MKRIILIGLFCLFPAVCYAGPFLVCDPYPSTDVQPTDFELVIDGGSVIISSAVDVTGGKALKYDVGGVSIGSHTVSVKACKDYDVWGRTCSSAVNFTFAKPVVSSPVVPANIKLSK
jgi:hypothetical protein